MMAVAVALPAAADTTVNPTVGVSIAGGSLSIAADSLTYTGNSDQLTYSHGSQQVTATTTLTADDLTGSGAGWHVTVDTGGLTGSNNSAHVIDASTFTVTGGTLDATSGSTTGVTANTTDQSLGSGAVSVLSAAAGSGDGTYTEGLTIGIAVPGNQAVDDYTGSLTITIATTP